MPSIMYLHVYIWNNIHRIKTIRMIQEEFEDTKRVLRILKSKKDRQDNGQKKMTNNDLQILHRKLMIEQHASY